MSWPRQTSCMRQLSSPATCATFLLQRSRRFAIEARLPDHFLTTRAAGDTALMKFVVTRQASALRGPPKTVADILQALSLWMSAFVMRVKQVFDQQQSVS